MLHATSFVSEDDHRSFSLFKLGDVKSLSYRLYSYSLSKEIEIRCFSAPISVSAPSLA